MNDQPDFTIKAGCHHHKPIPRTFSTPAMMRYPATSEELMTYGREFFDKCLVIANQRNHRYATPTDPFRNFRTCGEYGVAVRMTDKVSRLLTLTSPGAEVDHAESIEDTCLDLANYAMLLIALRANERS